MKPPKADALQRGKGERQLSFLKSPKWAQLCSGWCRVSVSKMGDTEFMQRSVWEIRREIHNAALYVRGKEERDECTEMNWTLDPAAQSNQPNRNRITEAPPEQHVTESAARWGHPDCVNDKTMGAKRLRWHQWEKEKGERIRRNCGGLLIF